MNKFHIIFLTCLISTSTQMAFGMDAPAKAKKVRFASPSMIVTTKSRGKRERAEETRIRAADLVAILYKNENDDDLPEDVPFDTLKAEKAQQYGEKLVQQLLAKEAQNKRERACMPSCQECQNIHEGHTLEMVLAHAPLAKLEWIKGVGANEAVITKYVEDLLK